ncbi:MAG TPA: right-handed parallel beta-helix repeat-containing protein [Ignavibacteriaceae bacterium]|nr:right-handed parallel beta-helix repeat-containing protein [Ignavibacteriaceae bacterium]
MKSNFTILILFITIILNSLTFADFPVRQSSNWDGYNAIAYNSTDHEYLVVWEEIIFLSGPIMGQRIDENGNLVGNAFTIFTSGVLPSVAYNSQANEYLVVCLSTGIYGQRVSNTGVLNGSSVQLMTESAAPRVLYNSLAGNYLLAGAIHVETPPSSGNYDTQVFTRKIGSNGQPIGSSQLVEDMPSGDLGNLEAKFALAYAPIGDTQTPYGRYLLVVQSTEIIGLALTMLDSDGNVIYVTYHPDQGWLQHIPFEEGSDLGGIFNVDAAYGTASGYSMTGPAFLIVWGDNNNHFSNQEWTGIYGRFVDPYKLDYPTDYVIKSESFPISAIYKHWAYGTSDYAGSWKPKVTFSYPGKKFMVTWRETPSTDQLNDTKVNHIRADKVFDNISYAPNVVLSAATGDEDPRNPAIAASTINPNALVAWEDYRNYSANNWDLYGNIYTIPAAPAITITLPNGGEYWKVGTQKNIAWSSANFSDPVKIEYSTDSGTSYSIIANSTNNDGSYLWVIPNTTSSSCIVKISDASDGDPFDTSDANFTIYSNVKTVLNINNSGPGSYRQAILDANDTPGRDTIVFKIPGTGLHEIKPLSPLPCITDSIVIDGYTQPGSYPNTNPLTSGSNAVLKIELDGGACQSGTGIVGSSGGTIVRGLIINHFTGCGLELDCNNIIEGNFVYLNYYYGIKIIGNNNLIGGTTPAACNVISGNGSSGIYLIDSHSWGTKIQGNLIGTQPDGINDLGNHLSGISIGGQSHSNQIGGNSPEKQNIIAYNSGDGIKISSSASINNSIYLNSIFSNGGLGINLQGGSEDANGVTFNDPDDEDTGPNNLQNSPVINSVEDETGTFINATLNSLPNTTYRIDFYSGTTGDPSGYGEGQTHIGWTEVTTDAGGVVDFYTSLGLTVPAGNVITATATDPDGNTSEFSNWVGSATPEKFLVTSTNDDGQGSLRQAIIDANAKPGLDTIAFNIPGSGPFKIQPNSALPDITDPVFINGYSQPASSPNTNPFSEGDNAVLKIELDGTNSAYGLIINAGNSIVRGLIFNHCHHSGIELHKLGGNIIEGNFFGTNFLSAVNSVSINIYSSYNKVGGINSAERNVISGSGSGEEAGLVIRDSASGNIVKGDLIGTDASGMTALGVGIGVKIYGGACYNTIGGLDQGAGNIISGNDIGVIIDDSCSYNIIQGNIIGLDRTGTGKLGNENDGVAVHRNSDNNYISNNKIGGNGGNGIAIVNGSKNNLISNNFIGTDESWQINLGNHLNGVDIYSACNNMIESNCIAFNNYNGIRNIYTSINNNISRNLISKNDGKGIENYEGGNNEIAPPVILSLTSAEVLGTAGPGNIVEIFSDEGDEGRYYLGSAIADGTGNFSLTLSEPCPLQYITATCRDEDGNTSEFSQSQVVSVELINLSAVVNENCVTITWFTATEVNNFGFDIERSSNGKDFIKVGAVGGYGTTSEIHRYSFTETDLPIGNYFYRLKQKDTDGSSSISNTIEAVIEPPHKCELDQNYPNPFNPETRISFELPVRSEVKLIIYDILGREIIKLEDNLLMPGYYEKTWKGFNDSGSQVSSGVYFCRLLVKGENRADFNKIIKMIMMK